MPEHAASSRIDEPLDEVTEQSATRPFGPTETRTPTRPSTSSRTARGGYCSWIRADQRDRPSGVAPRAREGAGGGGGGGAGRAIGITGAGGGGVTTAWIGGGETLRLIGGGGATIGGGCTSSGGGGGGSSSGTSSSISTVVTRSMTFFIPS